MNLSIGFLTLYLLYSSIQNNATMIRFIKGLIIKEAKAVYQVQLLHNLFANYGYSQLKLEIFFISLNALLSLAGPNWNAHS